MSWIVIEKFEKQDMARDRYLRIKKHLLNRNTTLIQYYILYFKGLHAHQTICFRYISKCVY